MSIVGGGCGDKVEVVDVVVVVESMPGAETGTMEHLSQGFGAESYTMVSRSFPIDFGYGQARFWDQ